MSSIFTKGLQNSLWADKYEKVVMVEKKRSMMNLPLQAPGRARDFNSKFYMNIRSLWIVGEVQVPPVDRIISRTNIGPWHILKDFPFYQI